MKKIDVYRFGIKTMAVIAVFAMLFVVFVGMNTQNVRAEVFETNIQVSASGIKPDITVDSTGNIYVVWEDDYIYCANSTDGGNTFGAAVQVSVDMADRPSIAVDANDNLHVAWIGSGDYIYYANSTDHGASFSTPVPVSDAEASGINRIGIDAFGNNVYIVWRTYEGYNLSLDKSINGGSFGIDVQVNDVDGSVQGSPAIDIGADETVYVVWQDRRVYQYRTYIANSTDYGASFGASVRVDDSASDTYYPSVATIGPNTVYVSWADCDTERIGVAKSIDTGASFSPSVSVSDTDTLLDSVSSIAVHQCGKIFVAWEDDKNTGDDIYNEIYFANSTDEGASFGTDVKVNVAPPTSPWDHRRPSLAVGNDTEVYVVWRDMRTGSSQIYFANASDATWPSKITDLDAVDATANSITLNWTAPGDNFHFGTATTYDIRYSTSPITDANWADATQYIGESSPKEGGSSETFEVTGLGNDTLYYFAIKTLDERNNTSPLSNVVSRKTLDDWAPNAVTNLVPSDPTVSSIKLNWTAPGDNGNIGTATEYDIRYNTTEVNDTTWDDAIQCIGESSPSAPGNTDSFVVTDLEPDTKYYFALKTADEVPNWSLLSNVVNETTLINHPPDAPILTEPANNTWITTVPTFTWTFSDQDTGDVQGGYHVQINDTLDWTVPAYDSGEIVSSTSSYTTAISDGTWYWRVRTMDNHDAWGNWSDPWVVKIDTTPPTNPTSCTELGGASNNTWQNSTSDPSFTWSGADDGIGSGVSDYYYYWGGDGTGNSTDYTEYASYDPSAPGEGTFYLRVRTRDNAGNNATSWLTIFIFKYDATPPTTYDNAPLGWQTTKPVVIELTPEADVSGIAHTYYKKWLSTENEPDYTEGTTVTLDADGIWNIKYYSVDLAGNAEAYKTKQVQIDTTPPTAVTLNQPTDMTKNSVTLIWSKNTDPDFKQYEIYKATKEDFTDPELVTTITDKNTTTYTVTDISPGTTYYFKIKVVDNAGLSTYSTQTSATTSALPKEEINWLLIGGIIGIIVIIVVIAIAVIMVKKKKGKTPENP